MSESDPDQIPVQKSLSRQRFDVVSILARLVCYVLYVTVVCIITFSALSRGTYYLTQVIEHLFVDASFVGHRGTVTTFKQSSTFQDFWAYTDQVIAPSFYTTEKEFPHLPLYHKVESKTGIEHENHLVGKAKLRQIRVGEETCLINRFVPNITHSCYPAYEAAKEDGRQLFPGEGGIFLSEDEIFSTPYLGDVAHYSGAGHVLYLPPNKDEFHKIIDTLKHVLWINRATRFIVLEFALFNPNINVLAMVRLAWEAPATGGVTTSWGMETIPLSEYQTFSEIFVFVIEMIFFLFTIYYGFDEGLKCYRIGYKSYLKSGWTYISLLIFVISWFCVVHSFVRYFSLNDLIPRLAKAKVEFVEIKELIYYEGINRRLAAILTFLVWLKLFKYLSFSKTIAELGETINKCIADIGGFVLIFLIVLLGFAQLGHALFGTQVEGFSRFSLSVFTLWRFIFGNFNYVELVHVAGIGGSLFYFVYMVFVFFILVNMFLAIINASFHSVHVVVDPHKENRLTTRKLVEALPCQCTDGYIDDLEDVESFPDMKSIRIEAADIRDYLQSKNFAEVDIEMFMERFNIIESDVMDGEEAHSLLADIIYNTYLAKTEAYDQVVKLDPSRPLPPVTNAERAQRIYNAEIQMLEEKLSIVETAVMSFLPKINRFLADVEEQLPKRGKGKKKSSAAADVPGPSSPTKRRSLAETV